VSTDPTNDKPLTNVVIQQVVIRREGSAAQAFDINAQNLPLVSNIPLSIQQGSGHVSLMFSNQINADNRFYATTNLSTWTNTSLGIEVSSPTTNSVTVIMDSPQKFFQLAQIRYPGSTFAPKDVLGRTLKLVFSNNQGTNTVVFDNAGGGTYSFPTVGSGTV